MVQCVVDNAVVVTKDGAMSCSSGVVDETAFSAICDRL